MSEPSTHLSACFCELYSPKNKTVEVTVMTKSRGRGELGGRRRSWDELGVEKGEKGGERGGFRVSDGG